MDLTKLAYLELSKGISPCISSFNNTLWRFTMRLTGPEREELTNTFLDAYPDQESLEMMLEVKLEKRLTDLAHGNSLRSIIFRLIGKTQAEGWTDKLIIAAHEWNPGNERF